MKRTNKSQATRKEEAGPEPPAPHRRGPVMEVLKKLLEEGGTEESVAQAVLALVGKLVSRNSELERRLAKAASQTRKNEGLSAEQLLLLLDELTPDASGGLAKADAESRKATSTEKWLETAETEEPARQPPARKPPPPELRRTEKVIQVPEAERRCPRCGQARECIGHDVTEVVDLIPAEVVVRLDRREKLACPVCGEEVVRAPPGDKVVAGGKLGLQPGKDASRYRRDELTCQLKRAALERPPVRSALVRHEHPTPLVKGERGLGQGCCRADGHGREATLQAPLPTRGRLLRPQLREAVASRARP